MVIEVGAGDGAVWSLSRTFVEEGWPALLIEKDPTKFRGLRRFCRRYPAADCIAAHCCAHDVPGWKLVWNHIQLGMFTAWPRPHLTLATILAKCTVRSQPGLLIVNARRPYGVFQGFDPNRFHPLVIAACDPPKSEDRISVYNLLSAYGYKYAGATGAYSVWSSGEARRAPDRATLRISDMPQLPKALTGRVVFDSTPSVMSSFGSISPGNHIIHGWAFVEPSWSVPPCVYLEVSDDKTGVKEYFQAYRCHRPDVSDHFHRPTLTMSGFRALVPLGHRERGAFSIRVLQSDGQVFYGSDVSLRLAPVAQNYETIVRQGLARKFLSGCGIEIGALQRPLPVPEHCSVRYIDRMPVSELLQQYPELGDLPLQQPDLIDDGEKLSRIAAGSQDFVIANHFLEHCENPIHTLLNMFRIIRVGGVIFLAVPDKRYTFDFARPSTDYETLKTTAQSGIRPDKMALYEEWVRYVMHHDSATDAQVVKLVASKYSIHYNVWNADELITFLCRARTDFSLPFILASVVCSENEAILTLEKTSQ